MKANIWMNHIAKAGVVCVCFLSGSLLGTATVHVASAGPTQCVSDHTINLCRYSTRDWTFSTFKGQGFSSSDSLLYKIATENIISDKCDGTWYRLQDSGWVSQYNAAFSSASTESGFHNCTYEHLYISESWHNYYDPGTGIDRFEYSSDGP